MMVNPANDIARQAHQGSVAAIIQILNEKLADSGIRTRAILAEGVLQLLCEASQVEQLEQSTVVERIRQILQSIAPQTIRRVKINSRIVREQQLLWLEEIHRDPENQLLWSQEITLARPGLLKQIKSVFANDQPRSDRSLPQTTLGRSGGKQQQFWRGMVGGAGLSLLLLAAIWAVSGGLLGAGLKFDLSEKTTDSTGNSPQANAIKPSSSTQSSETARPPDPFVTAVRIAEQASQAGLSAKSSAEWLELAAKWQQAADLMQGVSADDIRYKTARDRAILYQKNSEAALQQAQARRS